MNLTKEELIFLYYKLKQKHGRKPTKQLWLEDTITPSNIHQIKVMFGGWTNFVIVCGANPHLSP